MHGAFAATRRFTPGHSGRRREADERAAGKGIVVIHKGDDVDGLPILKPAGPGR